MKALRRITAKQNKTETMNMIFFGQKVNLLNNFWVSNF